MFAIIRDGSFDSPTARLALLNTPLLSQDRVLVRVIAAGVTAMETHWLPTWKLVDGQDRRGPVTLGHEFTGEIIAVGKDVNGYSAGDRVLGHIRLYDEGATAPLVSVHPDDIIPLPHRCDPVLAATLPLAGLTAWQAMITHGDVREGQKVLIHGGAGGVGHLAIQIARWRGAHVVTTCSGDDAEFCRSLGAKETIDFGSERFEEKANDVDLVLDVVGGDVQERSWDVVRKGGKLITIAGEEEDAPDQERARQQGIEAKFFIVEMNADHLGRLVELYADGAIMPVVGKRYRLETAALAFDRGDARLRPGKSVVVLDML
jgi:NADPH:quinone reductase-like Zn-dependent oxidoreductase